MDGREKLWVSGLSESALWFQSNKEGHGYHGLIGLQLSRHTELSSRMHLASLIPRLRQVAEIMSSLMSDTVFSINMNNLAATSPTVRIEMYHRHRGLPRYSKQSQNCAVAETGWLYLQ